jgi:hypothetical protein
MNILPKIWRFINLLSLDVVIGAMAGMLFFADALETSLPMGLYGILGMAVWTAYTADHLIDARKAQKPAGSDRHRFHQENFNVLTIILIVLGFLGFGFVVLKESFRFILFPGIGLALLMLLWMGLIHLLGLKMAWLKELSTALFYVLGVALAPFFSVYPSELPKVFYLLLFGYFLVALLNLFILSYIDEKVDRTDGFGSALLVLDKTSLEKLILSIAVIGGLIFSVALFVLPSFYKIHALLLLLLIIFHIKEFYKRDRPQIRKKLEASFLLPLALIAF